MEYVTGVHALNLGDRTVTPGDWHFSALDWCHPMILDSEVSPFGDYGISLGEVPFRGIMPVASHVRACLDLIEQGLYGSAQGMRENFIDNDAFDREIMDQVWKLRGRSDWLDIDRFIGHEYLCDWLDYKEIVMKEGGACRIQR